MRESKIFDERQKENYPPMEFCEDNCKREGFENLKTQHKRDAWRLKAGGRGPREYWYRRHLIRRIYCIKCLEAETYFIQQEIQQAKEDFFKILGAE